MLSGLPIRVQEKVMWQRRSRAVSEAVYYQEELEMGLLGMAEMGLPTGGRGYLNIDIQAHR